MRTEKKTPSTIAMASDQLTCYKTATGIQFKITILYIRTHLIHIVAVGDYPHYYYLIPQGFR